ncbi:hypothetical protein EUGRSUZ_H00190 [Eucalyptus grandis]|uniref:Uncharacterized protein n=2 Tax=Eucalyptus grandis TaxID=71139 RepID=A0ACC3JMF3_EUCGR|nr:hypothetical protein EUGRSUZ_H00190 [Eucalyptus grandis]
MADGCKGKSKWPELVGVEEHVAAATVDAENPNVKTVIVPGGSLVPDDFVCTRVWIWVNKAGYVFQVPIIG